jgi:hypothetical protein
MRYIKLYEDIDFSDIDDYDNVNCNVFLIGNGGAYNNYIIVIGSDGRVYVFGHHGNFSIEVIDGYNPGNNSEFLLGGNNRIRYNDIDIKEVIPDIMIVGEDISVSELKHNLSNYYCDDIDGAFDSIKNLLKEYLDK